MWIRLDHNLIGNVFDSIFLEFTKYILPRISLHGRPFEIDLRIWIHHARAKCKRIDIRSHADNRIVRHITNLSILRHCPCNHFVKSCVICADNLMGRIQWAVHDRGFRMIDRHLHTRADELRCRREDDWHAHRDQILHRRYRFFLGCDIMHLQCLDRIRVMFL